MLRKTSKNPDCQTVSGLMLAYLDGELDSVRYKEMVRHLSECPRCQNESVELRLTGAKVSQSLRMASGHLRPSPRVWNNLSRKINPEPIGLLELIRINAGFWRPVVKPVVIVLLATILAFSLNALHFLAPKSTQVLAESVVKNSSDIRNALSGQNIAQVEILSTITSGQGTFYIVSVTGRSNMIIARINLDGKYVSDIIPVNLPEAGGDTDVILNVALADSRVKKILAGGAAVTDVSRITDFHIDEGLVDNYGIVHRQGIAKETGVVILQRDGTLTRVTVDIGQKQVTDIERSSTLPDISQRLASPWAPVTIALGCIVLAGLFFRNRLAVMSAGLMSMIFGSLGLSAIISLPGRPVDRALFLGIPCMGLILGIAGLKFNPGRKTLMTVGVTISVIAVMAGVSLIIVTG